MKVDNPGRSTTLSDERVVGEMMSSSDLIIKQLPLVERAMHTNFLGEVFELIRWPSMVYKPIETPFLKDAGKAGCQLVYGWEMLLWQGAHALKIFTGRLAPSM